MKKPNFIVFLTDDHGYGDLSCMGSADVHTPHLDGLAADGARFTNWYSNSPVCSPARASLLTGRYPGNAGVRSILAGHRTAPGLPPHVPTLAHALKLQGYATAMSGKWHLGTMPPCRPNAHGFDYWFGHLAGCIDFYSHIFYWGMNTRTGSDPVHDAWENDREVWDNGRYFTELITEKALEQIRKAAAQDQPFFLYVAYNAPHYPMHAPKRYLDRFPDLPPDRRIMAAMISAVDDGVGEIMAEVQRLGLGGNTCTVFSSDNGPSRESRNWLDGNPDPYYGGTTGGLKGHKFSLFDGGVKVPGILHWPGTIPAGQVLDAPVAHMDVFPSLLQAAGGNLDAYELDGVDILPYACKGEAPEERAIFWEMGKQTAVRRGPWKLVLHGQLVESATPQEPAHLADLLEDPAEADNRMEELPELGAELTQLATQWRSGIDARWESEFAPALHGLVTH